MNDEIRRLWEGKREPDPGAERKLADVEAKIANVRKAIEEGLEDTGWANPKLRELSAESRRLLA